MPRSLKRTDAEPDATPGTGETSDQIWRRWSAERLERERAEKIKEQARADEYAERGIYPIEVARHIAQRHGQDLCPSWRDLRDLIPAAYNRILRAQPEMRARDVRTREQIIVALLDGLPAHLHGALSELRTVMELVGTAREATAFLIAFELGREAGRQGLLRDPRVMLAPEPARRAVTVPAVDTQLRLHSGEKGGA